MVMLNSAHIVSRRSPSGSDTCLSVPFMRRAGFQNDSGGGERLEDAVREEDAIREEDAVRECYGTGDRGCGGEAIYRKTDRNGRYGEQADNGRCESDSGYQLVRGDASSRDVECFHHHT